jgi:hypothetical protein
VQIDAGLHGGADSVGANLVLDPVSVARHTSTDSKAGEYEIRPYLTISERVGSELFAFGKSLTGQHCLEGEGPVCSYYVSRADA